MHHKKPPPANDRLSILIKRNSESSISRVTISDILGQILLSQPYAAKITFDVSRLAVGIYAVGFRTKRGPVSKKFVVIRPH